MKGETPQEKWDRVQSAYQKGVQSAYPNPERLGCPGAEVLQELAARSARFEDIEEDEHWKHAIHCGPCYREYLDRREAYRSGDQAKVRREAR
jgi:hypothetical protein